MTPLNIGRCLVGTCLRSLSKQTSASSLLVFNSSLRLNQFTCKFSLSAFNFSENKKENINIGTIGKYDAITKQLMIKLK